MSEHIEQRVIRTDRLEFSTLQCGSGPLALCLHGFPDSAHSWRHLLPLLAEAGFHAVAPFMRGYAPSAIPADGAYQTCELGLDANALHEALGADERAIVIGQNVRVQPAAVTHGSLTVTITEDPQVSQPEPFSDGQTVVVPNSKVKAEEEAKPMFKFGPGTTLDEIVRAVNQVGAAPSDLMAILEALKQAGALQADLIVI